MTIKNKVLFITGGHYTCAKAVIDELLKDDSWQVYYLGTKRSFEDDNAPSFEYLDLQNNPKVKFLHLTTGRFQRKLTSRTLPSLLKIPLGLVQSLFWLVRFQPKVILSFGGYLAVPVAVAGNILGINIITHEQTTTFGLANRIIQRLADRVLVSFKSTLPADPGKKWLYTGNPVRLEIHQATYAGEIANIKALKEQEKIPVVYLTGGKQGSHLLNSTVMANLENLLKEAILIAQIGDNQKNADFQHFEATRAKLPASLQNRLMLRKFIFSDEIGAVFDLADLVISRAGANTIFELAAVGKPALLVPISWSSGQEQVKNALELKNLRAAEIISEKDVPEKLISLALFMLKNLDFYHQGTVKAKHLVLPDSACRIVNIVKELADD